jgi:hypothetical protein
MIFASDLDRTIIFTQKFIKSSDDLNNIVCIEEKNSKPISYMTKKSLEMINEIKNKYVFIPVSTRGMEEFQRINFLKNFCSICYIK